jgi:ubiquinone/menaquinone biosynthesis C-methylase UbiE
VLEVGCGPGTTLAALHQWPELRLWAVEPNATARRMAAALVPDATVLDGHAEAIPAPDASVELVMTAGVLIHIAPDRLLGAMAEIARVASRYVLAIEYFAPSEESVVYHGAERIWRRDYGRLYATTCGLRPVSWGFFWRGLDDTGDGFDNTVWTLLAK